jgi:hypothetical protein
MVVLDKSAFALEHRNGNGIPPAPRGTPQIEVTFEIDENSILTVKAHEKGTGKTESITITNDKGRLTEEEIEKMIKEAEEHADEDKKTKERVDAKNAFDNYLHSMTTAVESSLKEKLDDEEKEEITNAVKDGQSWLAENADADPEDIKEKQKEIEEVCAPIVGIVSFSSSVLHDLDDDDEEDDVLDADDLGFLVFFNLASSVPLVVLELFLVFEEAKLKNTKKPKSSASSTSSSSSSSSRSCNTDDENDTMPTMGAQTSSISFCFSLMSSGSASAFSASQD